MAADADVKYKLEDILNKQKAPPQILDLVHVKIDTEEEYKNVIEKIPDYKIKPERVSLIWKACNNLILLTLTLISKKFYKTIFYVRTGWNSRKLSFDNF